MDDGKTVNRQVPTIVLGEHRGRGGGGAIGNEPYQVPARLAGTMQREGSECGRVMIVFGGGATPDETLIEDRQIPGSVVYVDRDPCPT